MTSENIFVDTSASIALADRSDAYHKKALSIYPSLLKTQKRLIISNLVVGETYILILKELGHQAALLFFERLKSSPSISRYIPPTISK